MNETLKPCKLKCDGVCDNPLRRCLVIMEKRDEILRNQAKHKFTVIESILISYGFLWALIIGYKPSSFDLFPIGFVLDGKITEFHLVIFLTFLTCSLLIGCVVNSNKIKSFALLLSTGVWTTLVSFSLMLNGLSMRTPVIVLAVASAYQFVQYRKGGGK